MAKKDHALTDLLERVVVVDTKSSMIVIGRLVQIAADCLVLENADVHDREEGYSSKELYVINAEKFGVQTNRQKVYVLRPNILAISALDDFVVD